MPVATTEASEKSKSGYQKIFPEEPEDPKKCKYNGVDKSETVIDNNETDPLNNEVSSQPDIVIPPDGGWGWLVVLASFMCNLIVDGTIFSFATFLPKIVDEFHADAANVTLVGSLMSGFYLIAGPFVSAIANRYGFRSVVIFGSLSSAAAFALCYFATSVTYLCVFYGLIGGIGFGFIYAPSIIILGFYFERWRGLATGIAVCGSGIGTFVYAPMTEVLITNFGWRGAMLCHAALILLCAVCGILYRPLKAMKIDSATEPLNKPEPEFKVPVVAQQKMEAAMRMMKRGSDAGSVIDHQSSIPRLLGVNNNSVYPRVSDVYHTICVPNGTVTSKQTPHLAWTRERSKTEGKLQISHLHKLKRMRSVDKPCEVTRPLYREDIFFNQSLKRLPQYTSQTSVEYNLSVTRAPTKNDIEEERTHKCMLCPEAFRRVLATMLDLSLFQSPTFIVLAVGGFFTMMGFFVPYMFLAERAKSANIENAIWLVSSIGIANTVGRMFYGLITSLPKADALIITNIALTVGGLATIFSGLSLSREFQFTYCIIFGLATSSFAAIRSVVVVDLLGLEKLTNAFGLLLLFQGIAAIIGAPLAGTFMKATGSFDACFYFSGGLILFSAILCYPLNWINAWEKRRHLETKSSLV